MSLNLPELPDGYFWNVRANKIGDTIVEIRKRAWFFSTVEEYQPVSLYLKDEDQAERFILSAANIALNKWNKKKDAINLRKKYYGQYPPKS